MAVSTGDDVGTMWTVRQTSGGDGAGPDGAKGAPLILGGNLRERLLRRWFFAPPFRPVSAMAGSTL